MKSPNLLAAALIAVSAAAHAQTPQAAAQGSALASTASAAPMTDGEVRKVDKEAGKVTLRHGRIENLDMPGMTMVFRVADPQMLDDLMEGEKVHFSADRVNGAITVTGIEAAK